MLFEMQIEKLRGQSLDELFDAILALKQRRMLSVFRCTDVQSSETSSC